jgi:ABC-type antimicrobial peptide transport system permease subunit
LLQVPPVEARILIRSTLDPRLLGERVRTAVQNVEPGQPVESIHTLDDARHASLAPTRMTATLLSLFAGIALVISAVGIGGVVGSSVSQRTREFGVQMALGAERRQVLLSVLGEGLTLALAGLALGLALSLVLSRSLGGLLYGVAQHDLLTLASVAFVLLLVTLAACFMPARRAASVDPMLALRGV